MASQSMDHESVDAPPTVKYQVGEHDSLASIALRHDVTTSYLAHMNRMLSYSLFTGQILHVPNPLASKHKVFASSKVQCVHQDTIECSNVSCTANCLLQLCARFITLNRGFIQGVLRLYTNRFIFEPSLIDPLVLESGSAMYRVSKSTDELISCTVHDDASCILSSITTDELSAVPNYVDKEFDASTDINLHENYPMFLRLELRSSGTVFFLIAWKYVPTAVESFSRFCGGCGLVLWDSSRRSKSKMKMQLSPSKEISTPVNGELPVMVVEVKPTANIHVETTVPIVMLGDERLNDESMMLTETLLDQLSASFPLRLQRNSWSLGYSTHINGISLRTLYRLTSQHEGPSLLVVRDTEHHVFGAYLSDAWRVSEAFYGTGESFLFSLLPQFKTYPWTFGDDFFMMGHADSVVVGGGGGTFGLWLDSELLRGSSHRCSTFDNDCIASQPDFLCECVELWTVQS